VYEKAVETHKEDYDLWVQKNKKIKTVFYQTVPASKKLTIMQVANAAEAWKALCKEQKNCGAILQVNILDQINALQTADGGDPRDTLDRLEELKADYASAGGQLDKPSELATIIRLLPPLYWITIQTMLADATLNKRSINPTDLAATIREVARDDANLDKRAKTSEAYSARPNPQKTCGHGKRDKSKDTCANCNAKGHWHEDCWSEGGGKHGQRPSNWKDILSKGRKGGGGGNKSNSTSSSSGTAATAATPAKTVAMATASRICEFAFPVATNFSKVEEARIASPGIAHILDSGASRHFEPEVHCIQVHCTGPSRIRRWSRVLRNRRGYSPHRVPWTKRHGQDLPPKCAICARDAYCPCLCQCHGLQRI
jgi:hypothetical protein